MAEMYRRKLARDKYTPTLTAVILFYSRIILKKLTTENKTTFRKLEKSVKYKCDADIKFIHFSISLNSRKQLRNYSFTHNSQNIVRTLL